MDNDNHAGARESYETAIVIYTELGDLRGVADVEGQLGTLA